MQQKQIIPFKEVLAFVKYKYKNQNKRSYFSEMYIGRYGSTVTNNL